MVLLLLELLFGIVTTHTLGLFILVDSLKVSLNTREMTTVADK